ncbi:protein phosphatase 2C domain-containing protein [Candidatus Parcubacteria bacterium]|nr:protein phosphatase 2C domain-containing protein [Candidatus Parcubacteria bacterium]
MNNFEIATGTVVGRDHRKIGKNNQDAYYLRVNQDSIIGIVSDGCGSAKYSETGAQLLVRLCGNTLNRYLELLRKHLDSGEGLADYWSLIQEKMLLELSKIALALGFNLKKIISNYLLATILGFVVTQEKTIIFSIGDGEAFLNGSLIKSGSFPGNAPPYFAFLLLDKSSRPFCKQMLNFSVDKIIETKKIETLLIGTDGVEELRKRAKDNIPGKKTVVGDISEWWKNDKYFFNKDAIRRQLFMINSYVVKARYAKNGQIQKVERFSGLLRDDTSMIVLRRKIGGGLIGDCDKK